MLQIEYLNNGSTTFVRIELLTIPHKNIMYEIYWRIRNDNEKSLGTIMQTGTDNTV